MKKLLLITTLSVAMTLSVVAQEKPDDICFQIYGGAAVNLVESDIMESSIYPNNGLRLGVNTRPETSSPYAALYGYPTIGIDVGWHGLEFLRYHDGSHLENIATVSGFIERPLLRWKKGCLVYGVNLGAGFNSAVYDAERNPLNLHFSSPLLIYVGGGVVGKWFVTDHLELGAALRLSHFSTGRLAYPNNGLNLANVEVSLRYNRVRPYVKQPADSANIAARPLSAEIYVGGGLHRCAAEWRAFGSTSPWPNYTQGITAYWRYQPHLSSGLGVDAVYMTPNFINMVEAAERVMYGDAAVDDSDGYDRNSVGVALTQQFHYGNFALFGSFGVYAHRHLGLHEQEGRFYQKAGVKFYVPRLKGLFLSADCLAHSFSHAAMIEFNIGYKI
ncbi:MAG: acyloxyacyl hydrolase [Bacteroidaceae bacterium]|nr:acyloxyacyl hydrolase [Bacteroidaceae bacterium]